MKDLKSRILKFAHSKRGLYDKGYIEDNWYYLKAEALKFAHKMEYNSAINNLAKWFKEHNEDIVKYRLTDIIVLGNDIFIYTQNPGLWLGKRAERLKEIEHRMNRNFNGDCLHDYKLYLVRDKDSSLMFFKHWFEQK